MSDKTKVSQTSTKPASSMIKAAEARAREKGVDLPSECLTDFKACLAFLQTTTRNDAAKETLAKRVAGARKYMDDENVKVQHFRQATLNALGVATNQFGGLTVAFRKAGNFVELSTAICSESSTFCAKTGIVTAVERLAAGHSILAPVDGVEIEDVIDLMFGDVYTQYPEAPEFDICEALAAAMPRIVICALHRKPEPKEFLLAAYTALAEQIVPMNPGTPSDWDAYAKSLLASTLHRLAGAEPLTAAAVQKFLLDEPLAEFRKVLAGSPFEALELGEKALASVRTLASQHLAAFEAAGKALKVEADVPKTPFGFDSLFGPLKGLMPLTASGIAAQLAAARQAGVQFYQQHKKA